jgi:hypothetical protein
MAYYKNKAYVFGGNKIAQAGAEAQLLNELWEYDCISKSAVLRMLNAVI